MIDRFFELGEEKYISIKVVPNNKDDTVVITKATFEMLNTQTDLIEQSGTCEIENDVVKALISPKEKDRYKLEFTVEVPPETLKYHVDVGVK